MESWKLVVAGGLIGILGIAAGALLFRAEPASAQGGRFTDCIIARQEPLDTNDLGMVTRPDEAHTIHLPAGYTVVSGGGLNDLTGGVLLCR